MPTRKPTWNPPRPNNPNHFKAGFANHDSRVRNHRNHPFFAGPYQFSSILSVLWSRSFDLPAFFRFGIPAMAPACWPWMPVGVLRMWVPKMRGLQGENPPKMYGSIKLGSNLTFPGNQRVFFLVINNPILGAPNIGTHTKLRDSLAFSWPL